MTLIRRLIRLFLLAIHFFNGFILSLLFSGKNEQGEFSDRFKAIRTRWHTGTAKFLALDIETIGEPAPGPVLVVANHISWLDIPVLAQALPVTFLSKAEVRSWPLIGSVAARGGTLFIQRGAKNAADSAIALIEQELGIGSSVLIFPEGTTTDGNQLRRFHPRLFAAAQNSGCPVQPVAIRYPGADDRTHTAIPFINNDTFGHSLWKVLAQKRIRVVLEYAPLITDTEQDRRQIAEQAHDSIRRALSHIDES
jgi:1-acyl-sn-glycerol-3-phosphate acyltransferase